MSRRRSFRSLIVVALLAPLLAVVGADPAAAEIRDADACDLDHGLAGTGKAIIQVSRDGWTLDRFVLDHEGRVVTIERRFNENEVGTVVSVSDRISRFLPDGTLDTTFGTNGHTELPGAVFGSWTRNITFDHENRILTLRATYRDALEVRRFTPDGELDTTFPRVEWGVLGAWIADPVGAFSVDDRGRISIFIAMNEPDPGDRTRFLIYRINELAQVGSSHIGRNEAEPGWGVSYGMTFGDRGEDPPELIGYGRVIDENDRVTGVMLGNWRRLEQADTDWTHLSMRTLYDVEAVGGAYLDREDADPDDSDTLLGTYRLPGGVITERVVDLGENDMAVARAGDDVFSIDADGKVYVTNYDFENDVLGDTVIVADTGLGGAFWPNATASYADGTWAFVTWAGPAELNQPVGRLVYVRSAPSGIDVPDGGELGDQITRLFQAYFQRQPGDEGLDFWRTRRANGQTLDSISDTFAASPEFIDTYGDLDNGEFVDLVYANVLGRAADAGGRANWVGHLDAGRLTRGRVMTGFSESAEFRGNTGTTEAHDGDEGQVHRLYNAYFGRDADRNGFCYWVRQLATGHLGLDRISQAFANSAEFQATYGELDDGEFVDLVYDNVLGRPADPDGREFWVGQLENGNRTRGQLMIGFSESLEYLLATDTLPS